MQASIVVATHNEGAKLEKTLGSVFGSGEASDWEVIVADDASDDGSVEAAKERYPQVQIVGHTSRRGASATKALGATRAQGEAIVFLDAHVKPEQGALNRLVENVIRLQDSAIFTPQILALDTDTWTNDPTQTGNGYGVSLATFDCFWIPTARLDNVTVGGKQFYQSPALIGCALALHRNLYHRLQGFDEDMRSWGVEDLDFGLKCWLQGYPILHDPSAVVGHRFRDRFDNYSVPMPDIICNQLRMARKNFSDTVWRAWVTKAQTRFTDPDEDCPEGVWARGWHLFQQQRDSAEQERRYLHANRSKDELWFAERFGQSWPRLQMEAQAGASDLVAPAGTNSTLAGPRPSPRPSSGPPALRIVLPADNSRFTVGPQPSMPSIRAQAKVVGVTPDPTQATSFEWTIQIRFDAQTCPHGPNRQINPPDVVQTVVGPNAVFNLSLVRGGQITLIARANIQGFALEASTSGMVVQGTNPARSDVRTALPNATLFKICSLESDLRQFLASPNGGVGACPLWSADGLGGAGLFQITNPPPSDDVVWNWRSNCQAAITAFAGKQAAARNYPSQIRNSSGFTALVKAFNANRQQQGLQQLTVSVPDFTSGDFDNNLQQLELDSIRGYNGWGGHDAFGFVLHEFAIATDANGLLVVQETSAGAGVATWARVPVSARPQQFGDPNYVNHVLSQPSS